MQLILTHEIAKELLALHDDNLAQSLARQFLDLLPEEAKRSYLFTPDVATRLLLQRFEQEPDETLEDLFRLLEGKAVVRKRAHVRGRKAPAPAKRQGRPSKKRIKTSPERSEDLKAKVLAFLRKNPWSSRKQIQAAIQFSSAAIYRRILLELKAARQLKQRGTKATSEYALAGAGGVQKKAPKTRKKIATKKTATKKAPKKATAKREPPLCPVPGCANKGAPIFGMMCKEHKDLPKEERQKLFADRRAAKA